MSFEKIEKETLTDELIKKDLTCQFKHDDHITVNLILFVVAKLFVFCLSLITPFAWFLALIPIALLLFWYIGRNKKLKSIENGEFTVVLDEVIYEKQGELRTEATLYKGGGISYLQFSTNGKWELDGNYYSWSERYKMSGTGICNTSNAKDTFYLVLYKDTQRIAMGYNTKFFDYSGKSVTK